MRVIEAVAANWTADPWICLEAGVAPVRLPIRENLPPGSARKAALERFGVRGLRGDAVRGGFVDSVAAYRIGGTRTVIELGA